MISIVGFSCSKPPAVASPTQAARVKAAPSSPSAEAPTVTRRSLLTELLHAGMDEALRCDEEYYSEDEDSEYTGYSEDDMEVCAPSHSSPCDVPTSPTTSSQPIPIPYPSPRTFKAWQRARQFIAEQAQRQQIQQQLLAQQRGCAAGRCAHGQAGYTPAPAAYH